MHRIRLIHVGPKADWLEVVNDSLQATPKIPVINEITVRNGIVPKLHFFCGFFSVPTLAEMMSPFREMTARLMGSFKSNKQLKATKCVVQHVMLAIRNARTFPGGIENSA